MQLPQLTKSAHILTNRGYQTTYDLWTTNNNNIYRSTSHNAIHRITFDDNSHIDTTRYCIFIRLNRQRIYNKTIKTHSTSYIQEHVPISDLQIGDIIPTNNTNRFGTNHNPIYAGLAGWVIGDGRIAKLPDESIKAYCACYDSDIETVLPTLRDDLLWLYNTYNKSSGIHHPQYIGCDRDYGNFCDKTPTSNILGRLLRDDRIVPKRKHRIPSSIWKSDQPTISRFLKYLYSADGNVRIQPHAIYIQLSQSNRPFLQRCRLLLNQFGIASTIYKHEDAGKYEFTDIGGKRVGNHKTSWMLRVSGIRPCRMFLDNIGFIQPWKTAQSTTWLQSHKGSSSSNIIGIYTKVKSVEYIGRSYTYYMIDIAGDEIVVNGHILPHY